MSNPSQFESPFSERESVQHIWAAASAVALGWTFLFFVILTNDISNFLNLYEWKFWKMIGMDKKEAEMWLLITFVLVTSYFPFKLCEYGIPRVSVNQLGPIKKFSMEMSGLCFFAIISNFYFKDVNYCYGFISLITIFPRVIIVLGFDIFNISMRDTLLEVAFQVIVINLRHNEFIVCLANLWLLIAFIVHRFRCIHLQPSHETTAATATATATVTTTATIATTRITTTKTTKAAKGGTMVNDHKLILNEQQELRRRSWYKQYSCYSP
ncbi:hypothetical protein ES332_D10G318600v1 [Gossypium tomentosum]|uniref:Uncharacterized protein n=1 Tax=Gossypium tomentosum TaxID=34277 RepID=A0A5D2JC30_GOSTO|nr:hypothetical protein ES332_D10G318600v1 [Gossypium tomentosum]